MKVTSLACIQGAWLPDIQPVKILDVGAGTGLLTLMAVQKYDGQFDAVEIEPLAYEQLSENVSKSPWPQSIRCHQKDIRDFAKENSTTYDLIITNPPFYQNQLKSFNQNVNHARHDTSLTHHHLINIINKLLAPEGIVSVLLPIEETKILIEISSKHSLYPFKQLIIKDNPEMGPKAAVTLLSKMEQDIKTLILHIKNEQNEWSQEYKRLLRPYYLNI